MFRSARNYMDILDSIYFSKLYFIINGFKILITFCEGNVTKTLQNNKNDKR